MRAMRRGTTTFACGLLALTLAACKPAAAPGPPPPQTVQVGKVRAFELRAREPGSPESMVGDLVLQGPLLRVEVQGGGRAEWRGAIVGLKQEGAAHDWESLTPLLAVDGALRSIRIEH